MKSIEILLTSIVCFSALISTIQGSRLCSPAALDSLVNDLNGFIRRRFSRTDPSLDEVKALTWYFVNAIDKDHNGMLSMREANFVRYLVRDADLTSTDYCGRAYIRNCDANNDEVISIAEFLNCTKIGAADDTVPSSPVMVCPLNPNTAFPEHLKDCETNTDCQTQQMCCAIFNGLRTVCLEGDVPSSPGTDYMRQGRCPSHSSLYGVCPRATTCESDKDCSSVMEKCCVNPNCGSSIEHKVCMMADIPHS